MLLRCRDYVPSTNSFNSARGVFYCPRFMEEETEAWEGVSLPKVTQLISEDWNCNAVVWPF